VGARDDRLEETAGEGGCTGTLIEDEDVEVDVARLLSLTWSRAGISSMRVPEIDKTIVVNICKHYSQNIFLQL
jgi:hypothetical protein